MKKVAILLTISCVLIFILALTASVGIEFLPTTDMRMGSVPIRIVLLCNYAIVQKRNWPMQWVILNSSRARVSQLHNSPPPATPDILV